ncbi:MAG: acylphosphatase [Myxococcota bacterium]|nr:acylphosphatase [Myxococcota bacterium]
MVSGRVQGVWFRASTQQRARSLGLAGWVRNLPDGRVELVARGRRELLGELLDWVREGGPPRGQVDSVDEDWDWEEGEMTDFVIRR